LHKESPIEDYSSLRPEDLLRIAGLISKWGRSALFFYLCFLAAIRDEFAINQDMAFLRSPLKVSGQRPLIKKGPNNEEAYNDIISLFIAAAFLPNNIYLLPIGDRTGNELLRTQR
jgi:hypothetical protein